MHRVWQEKIDNHDRVLILAPREHGKTAQVTVGRTLYELGRNTNVRIKLVSQNDDMAANKLGLVKRYIEHSERYAEVFPHVRRDPGGKWGSYELEVIRESLAKDVSVEAKGIMSAATGGRADILMLDDVVDFRNAIENPAMRPKVKQAYDSVWVNQLPAEGGRIIYICTVWHEDDLTHHLIDRDSFHKVVYNVGEHFEPVWPERWTKERLMKRHEDIGDREFDRAFRNRALTPGEATFPHGAVEEMKNIHLRPDQIDPTWPRYTGVDLAISKKESAAFTVIHTLALNPEDKQKVVVEIVRGKWTSPETARRIITAYNEHQSQIIMVENNAYQEALLQWINFIPGCPKGIPIIGFTTGKQKADRVVGLPGMAAEMDNGGWMLPMGRKHEGSCGCNFCTWIAELKAHPIGKYTDCIMASWFAREAVRRTLVKASTKAHGSTAPTGSQRISGRAPSYLHSKRGRQR